ncbi:hypothetical protein FXV75_08265 [Marinomonas sp. IMCC 4694]|nr:hypothetical protein FXV75_08265 [Marinomonas sp. IMCC 4694]
MGDRNHRNTQLITTNQAISEWDSIFGDSMMTVAAIDRASCKTNSQPICG